MLRNSLYIILVFLLFISCSSDSETEEQPAPDTIAPEVTITFAGFPDATSGTTIVVSNQINISIDAKDSGGIEKVEAFIDNEKVGEDVSAPYQIIIDVSNYASKILQTSKFKDYTLKVTVTDTSGNITSKEQSINIDNELPLIESVSLIEGTIINGDTNEITFLVSDNEELISVKTFLNDELLSDLSDSDFIENINTLTIEDGENKFRIEAIDSADNTASFEVNFISDNTGPEINLESIEAGQIVDELISINPMVNDMYSEVTSFEILIGDIQLEFFDGTVTDYQLDFNPENYSVGSQNFSLKASDNLGNETQQDIPIEIFRRLIVINIPTDFYDPQFARIYVFASSEDGKVLDTARIFQNSEEIILRTDSDISNNTFALTFVEYISGSVGNYTNLTTIQDLTSDNLRMLNLRTKPRFEPVPREPLFFSMQNFDPDDIFNSTAWGFGYSGGISTNSQFVLDRRRNTVSNVNTDDVYVWLKNETLDDYSYTILDWDLPNDFIIDQSIFGNENIERRTYQTSLGIGNYVSSINIFGYFSEEDFQNNVFHNINNAAKGFMPSSGAPYFFNTDIFKTRYEFTMKDYHTERNGEPLDFFNDLDWTIDYSISSKEITINANGFGHSVGKINLGSGGSQEINGLNVGYNWTLVFDSENSDTTSLPEIPVEVQEFDFFILYQNDVIDIQQVEIKRYEGLSSYNDYLNKVIKDNKQSYLVSPIMESRYIKGDGSEGYYYKLSNFLLD